MKPVLKLTVTNTAPRRVFLAPMHYSEAARVLLYRDAQCARWLNAGVWELPPTVGAAMRLAGVVRQLREMDEGLVYANEAAREWLSNASCNDRPTCDDPLPLTPGATEPWRHQRMSWWYLRWAREKLGAALLDCGMRTGKTRMVFDHIRGLPVAQRRALIFCPKSVVPVWLEQAERHLPPGELHVVLADDGLVRDRVEVICGSLTCGAPMVVVCGWSVLERLTKEHKQSLRTAIAKSGATVVADEVHFAKSSGSARSKSLAFISQGSPMRIGASGTPLAHSPLDAYGVFRFIDPGVWGGSFQRFRDHYAITGGHMNRNVVGFRHLDELADRMRPYTFRATRDVLQLPPYQDVDVRVELPPAAAKVYKEMKLECVAELKSGTLIANGALAKLTRLAQIASGYLPEATDNGAASTSIEKLHSAKEDALIDLLESSGAEPWVVFARFTNDLRSARSAAEKCERPYYELSGAHKQLDEWKQSCRRGESPVLGVQIQTGGAGVDMTDASLCCYMSVGYSLADYEQSRARIHGPDQTRNVAYYHVIAKGTVDVDIRRALAKRADVLKFVSDALVAGG